MDSLQFSHCQGCHFSHPEKPDCYECLWTHNETAFEKSVHVLEPHWISYWWWSLTFPTHGAVLLCLCLYLVILFWRCIRDENLLGYICIKAGVCLQLPPYLSVTPGKMKNIQKWIPNTRMTWKMTFPSTVFLRYSARSTTMVPNWIRTITKNGPGTWSSDREEVMSAAAECFWEENNRFRDEWHFTGTVSALLIRSVVAFASPTPHSPNLPQRPRSQRRWWQSQQCQPGTWAHIRRSQHCSLGGWGCRRTVWWAHIFAESCKTETLSTWFRRGRMGGMTRYFHDSIPLNPSPQAGYTSLFSFRRVWWEWFLF